MKINSLDGALILTSDFTLQATTKIEEFRATGLCAPGDVYNPGTPWYYHRFSNGDFEGHPLGFSVCFYQSPHSSKSVLTKCSFGASPWSEGDAPAKWSLEVDAQSLALNLIFVKRLLGKPHQLQRNRSDWKDYPALQNCAVYNYRWGTVSCGSEDPKTRPGQFEYQSLLHCQSAVGARRLQRRQLDFIGEVILESPEEISARGLATVELFSSILRP